MLMKVIYVFLKYNYKHAFFVYLALFVAKKDEYKP